MNSRIHLFSSLAFTLFLAACAAPSERRETGVVEPASALAPMPEAVTSFGAVTADGWLYVFGGHKGERHDYSANEVSGSFHRLRMSDGRAWESLPGAEPSQGLPLIAHQGSIYRIGGMAARNSTGTKQDLFSTAHFQRFDPRRGQWEKVASLPAPRSSHYAVVMGDKLYVAGGWQLAGGTNKPVWPANALVLDLKNLGTGWREFPPAVSTPRPRTRGARISPLLHRRHEQRQPADAGGGHLRHRHGRVVQGAGPAAGQAQGIQLLGHCAERPDLCQRVSRRLAPARPGRRLVGSRRARTTSAAVASHRCGWSNATHRPGRRGWRGETSRVGTAHALVHAPRGGASSG